MAAGARIVEGEGLHTGMPARVTLRAHPGPAVVALAEARVPVLGLGVVDTRRATTVSVGASTVAMVEHAFAACAGLGLHEGVALEIEGRELPLLDGAARRWSDELLALDVAATAPPLEVLRDEEIASGESVYRFARGAEPHVKVRIEFGDDRLDPEASWRGDSADFRERIAPARTFVFARELDELRRAGLARSAAPESAIVLTPERVLCSGRPFTADEPARHKLLDLIGDLFLYGGPPRGSIVAVRPGHRATHAVMRAAFERGVMGWYRRAHARGPRAG